MRRSARRSIASRLASPSHVSTKTPMRIGGPPFRPPSGRPVPCAPPSPLATILLRPTLWPALLPTTAQISCIARPSRDNGRGLGRRAPAQARGGRNNQLVRLAMPMQVANSRWQSGLLCSWYPGGNLLTTLPPHSDLWPRLLQTVIARLQLVCFTPPLA